jgi:hypothetical protein
MYISQYINDSTISMMDSADIIVGDADIGGIEGIMQLDQGLAWFTALSAYSSNMVDVLIGMGLPQIWSKRGARSTYYKDRNLIIIPELTRNGAQLLAHAVAHYVEHIGENLKAVEYVRNGMAFPGKLVMIRDGLYALDGPWLDMFDGVLRHDTGRLESLYIQGYEFSEQEINKMFTGMPTEFFPMMAQRVIRRDPVELSALWARVKKQLLLYLTVSDGNYIGSS